MPPNFTEIHAVPARLRERLPDEHLVVPHPVEVAGVEEVDPGVEGRVDRRDRLRPVGMAVEVRHAHAPEPQRRHLGARRPQPRPSHAPTPPVAPLVFPPWSVHPTSARSRTWTTPTLRPSAATSTRSAAR